MLWCWSCETRLSSLWLTSVNLTPQCWECCESPVVLVQPQPSWQLLHQYHHLHTPSTSHQHSQSLSCRSFRKVGQSESNSLSSFTIETNSFATALQQVTYSSLPLLYDWSTGEIRPVVSTNPVNWLFCTKTFLFGNQGWKLSAGRKSRYDNYLRRSATQVFVGFLINFSNQWNLGISPALRSQR